MVSSETRWPRRDVFFVTFVSVAIVFAIIGCSFVMGAKNSGRDLMTLVDGAYTGGVIAMTAAALVCLGALFLTTRDAIGTQLTLSVLLVLVHAWAIAEVTSRIQRGYEPVDDSVLVGQNAYFAAAVLQAVAAVIGITRFRRLESRTRRTEGHVLPADRP